ncbi:uncharacterized protein UTRI_06230_B [Ustilago trichophora]|uniref:Uncharacterized protein n=1 Tax=Ustilago trichophora TaxID=86804 RepID=A0A5C3EGX8_9BASI|nr:uncharacterized protein UTRI_06230_B [Ustilago trichophora]
MRLAGASRRKAVPMAAAACLFGMACSLPMKSQQFGWHAPPLAPSSSSVAPSRSELDQMASFDIASSFSLHTSTLQHVKHPNWLFETFLKEMQQWNLKPQPISTPAPLYENAQLGPEATRMIKLELQSQFKSKSLYYVGSQRLGRGPLRDFYMTPISIKAEDARYQWLQRIGMMNPYTHDFFGADVPSMMLISVPAQWSHSEPLELGLHGYAKLSGADMDKFQGELGRSKYTKSLSEVLKDVHPTLMLPLFPTRHAVI